MKLKPGTVKITAYKGKESQFIIKNTEVAVDRWDGTIHIPVPKDCIITHFVAELLCPVTKDGYFEGDLVKLSTTITNGFVEYWQEKLREEKEDRAPCKL